MMTRLRLDRPKGQDFTAAKKHNAKWSQAVFGPESGHFLTATVFSHGPFRAQKVSAGFVLARVGINMGEV